MVQVYCPVKDTIFLIPPSILLVYRAAALCRTTSLSFLVRLFFVGLQVEEGKFVRLWRGEKRMTLTGQTSYSVVKFECFSIRGNERIQLTFWCLFGQQLDVRLSEWLLPSLVDLGETFVGRCIESLNDFMYFDWKLMTFHLQSSYSVEWDGKMAMNGG